MFKPLFANQRRALLRVAAQACAASLLLAPFVMLDRFSATAANQPRAGHFEIPEVPAQLVFPEVSVKRDPFVSQEPPAVVDAGESLDGLVLPPNDAVGAAPIVRAIVSGDRPRALVDVGGRMETVGIGDEISGVRVTAIGPAGVSLEDGETLPFAETRP